MAERNITSVDLLESVTNKTNAIVEENGTLNKVNLHNEFNTINTKIDNEVNALSNNIAQLSNPNLLINSDFRNPVNQRGETSYTASNWRNIYSIDRWMLAGNVFTLSVNDGYITLTTGSEECYLMQGIEKLKTIERDKTHSVNVKSISGTAYLYSQSGNSHYGKIALNVGINKASFNAKIETLVICLAPRTTIELYWAKLEQGSIATPFVPRPYGEELALCKRYYQKFSPVRLSLQAHTSGKLFFRLPFECEMRVTPSVSMDSSSTCVLYKRDGWTRVVMFSLANVTFNTSTTYVDIMCTYSSSFVDATLDLIGGYIHADAEMY